MAESIGTPSFLVGFIAVVLLLLALDLGVFHRAAHTVTLREALTWTVVWVGLSVGFGVWILTRFGSEKGLAFFTGYLIEWALSVDNVFVFILIFSYFAVPPTLHHRVLFWGILGALIMRAFFIVVGSALIEHFHWILYIFGAFLVFTGTKVLRQGDTEIDPDRNPVVRWFRRFVPMVAGYDSDRFWVRKDNQLRATPLALVLLTVETTDLIFAVDSIPAIFAITLDPFIIYTSNVCAILGLRALYFLLSAVFRRFSYLNVGLGIVLIFVGIKMICADIYPIPIGASLMFVGIVLTGSILLSVWKLSGSPKPTENRKADAE